jgi:hypothetical protein
MGVRMLVVGHNSKRRQISDERLRGWGMRSTLVESEIAALSDLTKPVGTDHSADICMPRRPMRAPV